MCARLLSCPLCSQPGFVTLDALRAGLVSVATRPLACPVCNETLLGIDKLTIHLFGHTINTSHRCDARKAVENDGERTRAGCHGEATLGQQAWNTTNAETALLCERTRTEETSREKIAFVPLSSLNSVRSVAAIVVNKSLDSSSTGDSRVFATISAESTEKSQNQLIFVPNLSQQQFCSSSLIRTNDCSSTSEAIQETYRASIPIVFHGSPKSKNSPVVVSLHSNEHSGQTGTLCDTRAYPGDTFRQKSSVTDRKEESVDQFSETWIENLLQENSDNCSKACEKSASGEKSYSAADACSLSSREEKYCNYPRAALIQSESTNSEERQYPSQDSSTHGNKVASNGHAQSSLNSDGVSPQLKTLRAVTKDKTERCNICGIPVPDRNILVLHKQVVHMIAEKDVNSMPEELLENYPCHFCTKIFKNRGSLMVHMRIAHIGYNLAFDVGSLSKEKDGELPCCENGYNCPTCGKNFRKEQHVAQHLKTHEGKQWECDVCSKMFTTKYFLKKHKRLHSGEMPYKCTLCDKTFTFQQSYHKHRLYHKDDKPHTCITCGRSFKELSTLHNHERIHTGEKPFVCETCGKCFRQRVSYLVHRRIHTGVMPYKCVACGKNFRYKVSQRTHKCPAQPEDSGLAGSSDVATTQTAVTTSREDSSTATDTSIFSRDGGSAAEVSTSENKFILTVNSQGQPILTRESDVRTNYLNETQNAESLGNQIVNDPSEKPRLWNNLSSDNVSKQDLTGSSNVEKCDLRGNEKLSANDANDFFSLVMSPLENDLSSPSTEMEHLRLSSPRNDDARQSDSVEICEIGNASNALQNDLSNTIEGIIRDNCAGNSTLETINEESLKQLLYGINRKT